MLETCVLMAAICWIALLAACTSVEMPCSVDSRSDWIPPLIALSCCASACAELSAVLCAGADDGLAIRPCSAEVKLENSVSSPFDDPGVP